jgi:hypothetical protein
MSGSAGTSVTITGANFNSASSVKFNNTSAASFTLVSDSEIRVTVPAGSSTGKISVVATGGTAVSEDDFTVIITGTLTFYPVDDAYVSSSNPTSNYATAPRHITDI